MSANIGGIVVVAIGAILAVAVIWLFSRRFFHGYRGADRSRTDPPGPSETTADLPPSQATPEFKPPLSKPKPRSEKIFLSYRREDNPYVAGRVYEGLRTRFGEHAVFKDIDSVRLGVDFRKVVDDAVSNATIVLAIVGRGWLGETTPSKRRIDSPRDFVRMEIGAALQTGIPVIPLLIDGASMPDPDALPTEIKEFAFRNAISIRPDPDFANDMERLIRGIAADASYAEDAALKQQAEAAIQARQREESEQRIADAVIQARRHAAAGSYEAALTVLRSLGSPTPLVQAALAEIETQRQAELQRRLDEERRLQEEEARRKQEEDERRRQREEDAARLHARERETLSGGGAVETEQGGYDSAIHTQQPVPSDHDRFQHQEPAPEPEPEQKKEAQEQGPSDTTSRRRLGKLVAAGLLVASLAVVVYLSVRGFRGVREEGLAVVEGPKSRVNPLPPPVVNYEAILADARKQKDADPLAAIALIRKIPAGAREHAEAQDLVTSIRNGAAGAAATARQRAVAASATTQSAFRDGERQMKQADGLTDAEAAVPVYAEAAQSFSRAATAELTPQQLFQVAQDAFRNDRPDEAIDHAQRAYQRDSSYQPAVQFLNARRSEAAQQAESARKKAVAAGTTAENSEFKQALAAQQWAGAHMLPMETREALAKFREAAVAFERAEVSAAQAAQAQQAQLAKDKLAKDQLAKEVKEAIGHADERLRSRDVAGAQTEIDRIRDKDAKNPALQGLEQRMSDLKAGLAKEKDRAHAAELLRESRGLKDHTEAINRLNQAQKLDPDNAEIRTALEARRKALEAPPPPLPSRSLAEVETPAIYAVLDEFAAAYRDRSLSKIRAVYPTAPDSMGTLSQFDRGIDWKWIDRKVKDITAGASRANAAGVEASATVVCEVDITRKSSKSGSRLDPEKGREFKLEKSSGRWSIVSFTIPR